jgi:hypothetical protein
MNVAELIDILRDLDPDTIVEMAIVAPVTDRSDDITVDQYEVEGVLPRDPADHEGESVVWLIGGEPHDVDEFVDAIEGSSEALQTGQYADVIEIDRGTEARKGIFGR